jgi:hypothetical protein
MLLSIGSALPLSILQQWRDAFDAAASGKLMASEGRPATETKGSHDYLHHFITNVLQRAVTGLLTHTWLINGPNDIDVAVYMQSQGQSIYGGGVVGGWARMCCNVLIRAMDVCLIAFANEATLPAACDTLDVLFDDSKTLYQTHGQEKPSPHAPTIESDTPEIKEWRKTVGMIILNHLRCNQRLVCRHFHFDVVVVLIGCML